jgi:hypothetical protein
MSSPVLLSGGKTVSVIIVLMLNSQGYFINQRHYGNWKVSVSKENVSLLLLDVRNNT